MAQGQSKSQGQAQGQGQGQGMQMTDQDMLQIALNETKHLTSALNTSILEAKDEQLRRDYMTALGDLYSEQKQIFDLMEQKGFYNVKDATPQDIEQAKNKFSGQSQQGMQ